jgi:FPC/CPF motif-containing protein YcgG
VRGAMNPFTDPVALTNSSYSTFDGRRLVRGDGSAAPPLMQLVHDGVRALVLNDQFSCVGGKSALRHGTYRFGMYSGLGTDEAAAGLARDLCTYVGELPSFGSAFSSYIASFDGPHPADEIAFEADLWQMLQMLHDLDAGRHRWDPGVSDDPADPQFSFSFGGVAFFVLGLHAGSSRAARRFAWPTLVFNPHRQFEQLREAGTYSRFQQVIRAGERRLQGDINPMMADFGSRSEAAQYSGRRTDAGWTCPFHAHADDDSPSD